jgi:uncharacterized membrane protein
MGSFSFFHFFIIFPFLLLLVVVYVLFRILRKPRNESFSPLQPETVLTSPATPDSAQQDKIKWLASGGYIFALTDAFLAQLVGFYQFYFFGFHVCLITLVPFVIFYYINKSHEQPAVAQHLKSSIRLYGIYAIWSIANGILLSNIGTNIIYALLGVGISIVMLGVLIWLAVRCGQGIIAAFKLSMPNAAIQKDATLPTQQ